MVKGSESHDHSSTLPQEEMDSWRGSHAPMMLITSLLCFNSRKDKQIMLAPLSLYYNLLIIQHGTIPNTRIVFQNFHIKGIKGNHEFIHPQPSNHEFTHPQPSTQLLMFRNLMSSLLSFNLTPFPRIMTGKNLKYRRHFSVAMSP